MQVRFEFRRARIKPTTKLAGTANGKPEYDGSLALLITLNGKHYGPWATRIKTYHTVWLGLKAVRMSDESRALAKKIETFKKVVHQAHDLLISYKTPFDGELLLKTVWWLLDEQMQRMSVLLSERETLQEKSAAHNQLLELLRQVVAPHQSSGIVTLQKVYDEFMTFKRSMIQNERKQRRDEQISDETYKTYPKRWRLILSYLQSIRQVNLPIDQATYPFTTGLKEWLLSQPKLLGGSYHTATINKSISFLKSLVTYAQSKGYVRDNPIATFRSRGGSPANPKPLTETQVDLLENFEMPPTLRHYCDSWLVALELCLHYTDYMELRSIEFVATASGRRMIDHARNKLTHYTHRQVVDVTDRCERILAKWGGVNGLVYASSQTFSKHLKRISRLTRLTDRQGEPLSLEFGMGRDTGLTMRAKKKASAMQLTKMGGWSKPAYANRYIGLSREIVEGFIDEQHPKSKPGEENSQSPS